MKSILKEYFGFSKFGPYHKEIVEIILEGKDFLVVMATNSGKSLCYQVPPLIAKKTAVVISPLISLMQDQVMALKQRGIQVEYLSSTQTNLNVYTNAESGRYDLLYMTPEKARLLTSNFWSRLTTYEKRKQLSRLRVKAEKIAEEKIGSHVEIIAPIKYCTHWWF